MGSTAQLSQAYPYRSVIALVTARGGSKRIPRKNVLDVGGKPLIAWTIEAARQATAVARVVLSTDDTEIAEVGRAWGAEVPFLRPPELAHDTAAHVDVLRHAIGWLHDHGAKPDYLLLLQPTTPLRTAADIDGIVAFARQHDAESAVSVCSSPIHPYFLNTLDDGHRLQPLIARPAGYLRTQDLPPAYGINGALYLLRPDSFLARDTVLSDATLAYIMSEERSLDVDTPWQLRLANLLLRAGDTGA